MPNMIGNVNSCLRTITVEPVVFLFMFVDFAQYGLFQDLTYLKVCQQEYNDSVCYNLNAEGNEVALTYAQSTSSYWIMGSTIALIAPSMIFTTYLGSWSDKYGRKFPLLMPPIGGAISIMIYIFMSIYYYAPVWLIIPANFVLGLFGGFVSCIMTCMSYISAISTEKERTIRISRTEAMDFLGGAVGPFVSGALLGVIGHAYTFFILLIVHIINILYISIFIKNISPSASGEEELQMHSGSCCKKYFNCYHVEEGITTAFRRRERSKRKVIILLLIAVFVVFMAMSGEMDIVYLYTTDKPLFWSYNLYSYYSGFKEGMGAVALLIAMPIAKYFGLSDMTVCIIGVFSRMAGLILLGLSYNTTMMFFVPVVAMLSYFTIPTIRSQLSKLVEKSEQGKILSFVAILENTTTILASLIYNTTYPYTRSFFHGLLFELSAAILVIPLIIFGWLYWNKHLLINKPNEDDTSTLTE